MTFEVAPIAHLSDLRQVYDQLIAPNFPAHELSSFADIAEGFATGHLDLMVARQDGELAGSAIASWFESTDIMLLAYLAVSSRVRGGGVGGRLLRASLDTWQERFRPQLIIGEVEDPRANPAHPQFGDPKRRWAFYRRHGARLIDANFTMPRLFAEAPDAPMLLISLGGSRHAAAASAPIAAQHDGDLAAFFTSYIAGSAEPRSSDGTLRPQMRALLESLPAATLQPCPTFQ